MTSVQNLQIWNNNILASIYAQEKKRGTYRSLSLGRVHECRADRCREDHITEPLLFKYSCSGLCSIECTVDIDVHNLLELFGSVLPGRMLGANAGVGHDHIQFSKVLHYLINGCRDFFRNGDIGLVSVSLCLIFRSKLFRCLWSSCSCMIENGNLGEGLRTFLQCETEKNCVAHTLAPASAYAVATVRPIPRPPPNNMSVKKTSKEHFPPTSDGDNFASQVKERLHRGIVGLRENHAENCRRPSRTYLASSAKHGCTFLYSVAFLIPFFLWSVDPMCGSQIQIRALSFRHAQAHHRRLVAVPRLEDHIGFP